MKLFKKKREDGLPITGALEQRDGLNQVSAEENSAEEAESNSAVVVVNEEIMDAEPEEEIMDAEPEEEAMDAEPEENGLLAEPDEVKSEDEQDNESPDAEEEVVIPDELSGVAEFITKLGLELSLSKIPMELIEMVAKGLEYDNAVAAALAEGELKGRNVKIAECFMRPDSDGLPHLGSQGSLKGAQSRTSSIFDLARGAIY